ncbi:MAG TPA: bifunctional 4-hydroxy-2-oxoglutarate aldolase/2-dehydro-3-deoxy-phosphogluconate aldolase [Dehalococcoidia bacterium]|jgi:2-dehydro-3-deoxyphosphogluconate aldolase/(4S)-4-hydroxy-2-oxoglutarate aldolase|nr:bifunctional 4-hydroxy-2-oxoglutarate aldolase/2-dehydro-3-deoxy-phosphogluconate aldolase [Dehalococcoidia bacterium]
MESKEKNLQDIIDCGIIAIVRVASAEEAVEVCGAIARGGVKPIEVTMTVPGAIDAIKQFKSMVKEEVLVGAGTVLDPETARAAILAGAEFIVSPTLNLGVIEVCRRYSKIVIPGTFTPTEILTAWEAGADIVKVFPATVGGPKYLKDILGPLPQVRLCPTGGVTLENTPDFIRAGAVAVAAGTSLVDKKAVAEKNYDLITETARKFCQAVKLARAS